MNKFIRYYNQNRVQLWIIVIIIIFILAIIQILNQMAIEDNKNNDNIEISENNTKYEVESESIVSDGSVSSGLKDEFGDLVKNFLDTCFDGKYDDAYNLLSSDCKNELYPTREIFIDQYCSSKFKEGKTYDFQSWSTNGAYIYQIKIYDNMLASGRLTNKTYIEDFYSIVDENDEYKLNINKYIGLNSRNKENEKENIKISIDYSELYMDYEIYTLRVKNNTNKTIMLDSRNETENVYVSDDNNYEYEALLYELLEEELIVHSGEEKNIKIKFSNVYNDGIEMKKLVFSKIIKDYDNYLNNQEGYNEYLEIIVDM